MPLHIRAATNDDLALLAQLNEPVQSLHAALYPADFKGNVDAANVASFFERAAAKPESSIAIAEQDGLPVGYIWFDNRPVPKMRSNLHSHLSTSITSQSPPTLDAEASVPQCLPMPRKKLTRPGSMKFGSIRGSPMSKLNDFSKLTASRPSS